MEEVVSLKEKEAIIFDLDGTLALSKSAIDDEMAELLRKLLDRRKVLVISGGEWKQFQTQLIGHLQPSPKEFLNLFISTGSGSALYRFEGEERTEVYSYPLSDEEKERITDALTYALSQVPEAGVEKTFGERIEDRGTQISFSGLGQDAPLNLKEKWDPDRKIRGKIIELLKGRVSEFEIRTGGTTTIDITKEGKGKAFGIREFSSYSGIPIERMVYVGDALYPGGNDEPARSTGIECVEVKTIEDTKHLIQEIVEH